MTNLPSASFQACVTDPQYEIGFMASGWDGSGVAFEEKTWRLVHDLLAPGGHLLAFGGPRTYHRMVCAIEDAGFEIRDSIMWLYSSGMPKGGGLKPAFEPIVMARKPFKGTLAANVAAHGTGALNIDGCRTEPHPAGRWPANVVLSHGPGCKVVGTRQAKPYTINRFDDGAKPFGGGAGHPYTSFQVSAGAEQVWECVPGCPVALLDAQSDGASRCFNQLNWDAELDTFTYCSKASTREREAGLDERFPKDARGRRNVHKTVKPVALMRHLVRLVAPSGGTVLDPFCGSGTTGMACALEGFGFLGIELDAAYAETARARIAYAETGARQPA
jgi:site-specific DNA-methyltransferase (adenine-specific)